MAIRTENDIYESVRKQSSKASTGFHGKSTCDSKVMVVHGGRQERTSKAVISHRESSVMSVSNNSSGRILDGMGDVRNVGAQKSSVRSGNIKGGSKRIASVKTARMRDRIAEDTLRQVSKNKKIRINGKYAAGMALRKGITSIRSTGSSSALLDSYATENSGGESKGAPSTGFRNASDMVLLLKNKNTQYQKYAKKEYVLGENLDKSINKYEKVSSKIDKLKQTGAEKDVRKLQRKLKRQENDVLKKASKKQKNTNILLKGKRKKKLISWIGRSIRLLFAGLTATFALLFVAAIAFGLIIMLLASSIASSAANSYGVMTGNAYTAYMYFKEKGLNDVQCAAILGNLKQECSSFDPTIDDGNALGIMQWTGGQRSLIINWASSQNLDVYDMTTQLKYAWEVYIPQNWYFANYTGAHAYPTKYDISLEEWQTLDDIELATGAFCACSEKPYYMANYEGESYAMLDTRIQYAQEYLNAIQLGLGSENIPGAEVIHGVPYYNQGDFAAYPYDDGTIADSGCGPTCMAMVASYLTGKIISPVDTALWGMANGANSVQTWSAFPLWCEHYGLNLSTHTGPYWGGDATDAVKSLKQGSLVICSMDPGFWTNYGHYIVLTGISSDGRIYVNDPSSRERTNASPYYYGTVFNECIQYWIISK